MTTILHAIEAAFPSMIWTEPHAVHHPGGFAREGRSAEVQLTVVEFSIEDQGFPPGSKGYDGAAVIAGVGIVHLSRELAEKAFKYAQD